MLSQLIFPRAVIRLVPLLVALRGGILLCIPGLRRKTTILHECGVIIFCLYLSAVCRLTVNVIRILHGNFEMGAGYNLTPLAGIKGVAAEGDTLYVLLNVPGNVAMFVPLGFLLPLLWRCWPGIRVFSASMLLSCGIEALQLFTGRAADIDDVLLNTLGGVLGYAGFRAMKALLPTITSRFRLQGRPAVPLPIRFASPQAQLQLVQGPQRDLPNPQATSPAFRRRLRRRRAFLRSALFTFSASLCALLSGAVLLGGAIRPVPPSIPIALAPQADRPTIGRQSQPLYLDLHSANALLVSGEHILYAQRADRRIYPASMTKIMTAILALEAIDDLQQPVTLREGILTGIHNANLATAGFLPGEEVPALDLLYGLLLPSGAECAVALAEHIDGTEAAFAARMNDMARQLGMHSTRFTNATGLHNSGHYTTAADMALLLRCALENSTFRAISSSAQHSAAPTNLHPDGITFHSTLLSGTQDLSFPGGALRGGKTGYTDEAGQCLASFAEVGEQEYILITAGARPQDFRTEQLHIADALTVYRALSDTLSCGIIDAD